MLSGGAGVEHVTRRGFWSMARKSTEEETHAENATEGMLDGEPVAAEEGDAPADDSQVAQLEAELAEWKDRALRAAADMENVRRRARLDADEARKFANETLMSELLPVVDNFARALEAAEQTSDFDALKSGVDLI